MEKDKEGYRMIRRIERIELDKKEK